MLPDILNYIPDPKNGRPIADGRVYFLIGGYNAPMQAADIDVTKIAEVTANGLLVPQPIYTSKGGTLIVGSPTNQPNITTYETRKVAVYDKCGKLIYQVNYNAIASGSIISESTPSTLGIPAGTRWYNPTIPATFVYYDDGDSGQWVEEASQGVDGALRSDLASTTSTVSVAGVPAKLFRQFIIVQPTGVDAGAYLNSLIAEGITNIFVAAGTYTFNTNLLVNNARLKLLGAGKSLTKFVRGASLGTSNIITGTGHDLEIEGIGFDLGKGAYTPNLLDATLENAINSVSPARLKVTNCDFSNLVNYGIVVNGTSVNEAKDIDISANTANNGTRGFAMVRRYGKNVHVDRNNITNVVDVANTLFKPIEVSGSLDVSICDNVITQTNGAGGPVIVEYIDRESVNVSIQRNHYYGPAGEAYFKVGAASNVWFTENHTSGLADIGAYFEGCENLWVCNNRLVNTRRNSIVFAQDFDTSRYNKKVKVLNNHFVDANRDNSAVGVPYTSTGTNTSYCAWVQDNTEQIEFSGNHYIKGTNECGGLLISSPSYSVKGEDFSKLGTNAVTINNSFAPGGAEYEIGNSVKCATIAKGEATILSGQSSILVDPPIVKHYWPNTTVTLKTALSASAVYVIAEGDVPPKFALIAKAAGHANATLSANATLFWSTDCSKQVKGILGKTV